jgi:hypothetical protein
MEKKKYIPADTFCFILDAESNFMAAESAETKDTTTVDDGTELGAKKDIFDDEGNSSGESKDKWGSKSPFHL